LSLLDALERGAVGNMPAPNFTRYFADVQRLWEAGDRERAQEFFDRGVPFAMWTMQSIDHSVTAAKVELHRLGVIASPRLRQPTLALDEVARGQLARFLDRRRAVTG
jgi:dihydrodipicolinate synthase/N-acetylneuraminate lyase